MFYFKLEDDYFTRMLTQIEFDSSEPHFDEKLFGANPRLDPIPIETMECGRRILLLEKQTGSWCFLEPVEFEVFRSFDGREFRDMLAGVPDAFKPKLPEFAARLYWLGLLELNGRRFIEPAVFNEGPMFGSGFLFLIIPTERCNLACKYCCARSHPLRQESMGWHTAKRAIDLIIDCVSPCGVVEFVGGEPFLEMDLIERTVKYAKREAERAGKQLSFTAQTNGTLLTSDLMQRIEDLGIWLSLSLDGDPVSNDTTRVFPGNVGSHQTIERGMALMRERNRDFGAICVVSKANYRRFDETLEHFTNIGLDHIKLNHIDRHGRAKEEWETLGLEPEEFFEVHARYLDRVLNDGCRVRDSNTTHMLQILASKIHPYRCMRSQCGAGRDFITFATEGSIYPCPEIRGNPKYRLGHVAEVDRLDEVWKSNPLMVKLTQRQVGAISKCNKCSYKRFCEAGCPINSYEYYGTTKASHPWCRYYKLIYSELFRRLGDKNELAEFLCPEAKVYDHCFFPENAA